MYVVGEDGLVKQGIAIERVKRAMTQCGVMVMNMGPGAGQPGFKSWLIHHLLHNFGQPVSTPVSLSVKTGKC